MLGEVSGSLNTRGGTIDEFSVTPERLGGLIALVREGVLSSTAAKSVFHVMESDPGDARAIAERDGLLQVGDDAALVAWIDEVWAANPDEATRFAGGERKLQGVLVGLVMKRSKGRADPKKVNQLLAARVGT